MGKEIKLIKTKEGFPVTIDIIKQEQIDPAIGVYPQFVVAGNGIVLGHSVSYHSAVASVIYFKENGFGDLPATIMEAMRKQHQQEILNANDALQHGKTRG